LTFISLSGAGEGVISFKMNNMEWETLIDAARNDLQSSFLRNDSLFFISSSPGTDNVYLLTPDNKTEQLTRSRYGAIDVSQGRNNFIFSVIIPHWGTISAWLRFNQYLEP